MDEKCILDPQRDCLGLQKANMLEKQLERYMDEAHETHSKIYDRLKELEITEAARNEQYKQISDKLDILDENIINLTTALQSIKEKPAKRWENIVEKVILLVVTALVGFILIKLGLPA